MPLVSVRSAKVRSGIWKRPLNDLVRSGLPWKGKEGVLKMSGRYPNESYVFNQRQSEAYKGYLITAAFSGYEYMISKDRVHIGYAKSVDEAKKIIDEVSQ